MSRHALYIIFVVMYCLFYIGIYTGIGFGCFIMQQIYNAKFRKHEKKQGEDDLFPSTAPLPFCIFLWPLFLWLLVLWAAFEIVAFIVDKVSSLGDRITNRINEDVGDGQ